MHRQLGSFVVLFKPGEVTGQHSEREIELGSICKELGGFACRVFDSYLTYSKFSDAGLLVRIEERNKYGFSSVAFFYPPGEDEKTIRRIMINSILNDVKNNPKLVNYGYRVVIDTGGNLKLKYKKGKQLREAKKFGEKEFAKTDTIKNSLE